MFEQILINVNIKSGKQDSNYDQERLIKDFWSFILSTKLFFLARGIFKQIYW